MINTYYTKYLNISNLIKLIYHENNFFYWRWPNYKNYD